MSRTPFFTQFLRFVADLEGGRDLQKRNLVEPKGNVFNQLLSSGLGGDFFVVKDQQLPKYNPKSHHNDAFEPKETCLTALP